MNTLRRSANPLSKALRELMESRHGKGYGSMRRLADKVQEATKRSDPYKTISRQLDGTPKWQLVEWVLDHCAPDDAEEGWRDHQVERLAGIYYSVHEERPPRYTGKLIVDGATVEDAISSPEEARDPTTQVMLLQQEIARLQESFERGEALSARLRDQVAVLQGQLDSIQRDYTTLQSAHDLIRQTKQELDGLVSTLQERVRIAEETAESLERRVRNAHEEANFSQAALEQKKREHEELEQRELQTRVDLAEARDVADRRYHELDRYRQESDEAQRRLRNQIIGLQRDMIEIRERFQGLDSRASNPPSPSSRPPVADTPASSRPPVADSQEPRQPGHGGKRGPEYNWMLDDDQNLFS
ncbi:hypothetical protein DKT68_07970 [Micromonospora acroterricola]|uniref:Uncharacterized protein n=1 Tax=Micromonospora acroterricola TaxID=2202421 RepID=A0A317D7T4_9ACTN|nr:hypothetical protein [Micromonospora acroterricola]PWR10799.1 hypothetical protein DKT68_07970 [Micromonospora acroterricola]